MKTLMTLVLFFVTLPLFAAEPTILLDDKGNVIGLLYIVGDKIEMRQPAGVIKTDEPSTTNPTTPPDGEGLTGVAKVSFDGMAKVKDPNKEKNRKVIASIFLTAQELLRQEKITEAQAKGPASFDLVPKVLGKETAKLWAPWQRDVVAALDSSDAAVVDDLGNIAKGLTPNDALNPVVLKLLLAFIPMLLDGDADGDLLQVILQIIQELF